MIDIRKVRSDFPILEQKVYGKPLVYLDNGATTQKPKEVLDRVYRFYSETYSNIHRGVHYLSEQSSTEYEHARDCVKNFIGANNSNEIIFTRGTTESINLVANSFGDRYIERGDEIIISEMEHHSNIVPWQMLCKRKGSVLKVLTFDDDGQLEMDKLNELITEKTKLISLVQISNVLGTVNPVKEIIETAHKYDIPVLIDGAQVVQHTDINVKELDCDFFVFSGHKMYAETGIGVFYGKEKWLEAIPPYQGGGGHDQIGSFR